MRTSCSEGIWRGADGGGVSTVLSRGATSVIEPENRVEFIVGERPVCRGHRGQHVGVKVDLVKRDGIGEAIVKVVSHRSTSIAAARPGRDACQATARHHCPA